jgi:hypothetical protein
MEASLGQKEEAYLMLDDKRIAYGVLIAGILAAILAIVIDPLRGLDVYLHWSQIVILAAGIVVALVGAYLSFVRTPPAPPAE